MNDAYALVYQTLRASVLGRHFALNTRFRTNGLHDTNALAGQFVPADAAYRWDLLYGGGENPLMIGGLLMICLAIEDYLGHPEAATILSTLLDSIGSLFKFSGNGFDGYPLRWDPVQADSTCFDAASTSYNGAFYVNPDLTYSFCTSLRDPRSRRLYTHNEWAAQSDDARNANGGEYASWIGTTRVWEPSPDELVGLMAGYDMVYRLTASSVVRTKVQSQVNNLGAYLSSHSYYLVRPGGGFAANGGPASLQAMELPFTGVFARITGNAYPSIGSFQAAMEKADVWGSLAQPWTWWTIFGVLLSPGQLAQGLIQWPAFQTAVTALGLGQFVASITTLLSPVALCQMNAIMEHLDVFDVGGWRTNANRYDQDEQTEFALAYGLSLLDPSTRFDTMMTAAIFGDSSFTHFAPLIGMTALDEPGTPGHLTAAYGKWLAARRALHPGIGVADVSGSCFASGVALVTQATGLNPAEEFTLKSLLDLGMSGSVTPTDLELVTDLNQNTNEITGSSMPAGSAPASCGLWSGLDFMVGLALAWLYRQRMQNLGLPVTASGFPALPDWSNWPQVRVPGAVIQAATSPTPPVVHLPIDQIMGSTPVVGPDVAFDWTLAKSTIPPAQIPVRPQLLIVDNAYDVFESSSILRTGVFLKWGDDFQLDGGGSIRPGGWLTGSNGPDGQDSINYDRSFPMVGQPDGHPYSLIGRLGDNGAYFFIGEGLARQPFYPPVPPLPGVVGPPDLPQTLEVQLRTNDNAPGGGTGKFTCRVRVWGEPWDAQPLNLDFADQPACDQNGPLRAALLVTVNNYMSSPLTLVSATLSGAGASSFTLLEFTAGELVPPNGSAAFLVRFVPTAPSSGTPLTAVLTLATDSPFKPSISVAVQGTAVALPPTASAVPPLLTFGGGVWRPSPGNFSGWVTITNEGSARLRVTLAPFSDPIFKVIQPPPEWIPCSNSAQMQIGCKISWGMKRAHKAQLVLGTNDPNRPKIVIQLIAQPLKLLRPLPLPNPHVPGGRGGAG